MAARILNIYADDASLLSAARQGDEGAFKQIHEKYYEDLLRIALSGTHDIDDARDIVQECFIGFWKNLQQVEHTDNLGPYLYVALRNRLFTYYQQRKVKLQQTLQRPFEPIESAENIYSVIRTKEMQACIAEAIALLPARMQEVFRMSRERQMTIGEIANELGRSPQTVKNQLGDATQRIREHLIKNHLNVWWLFI